MATGKTKPHIDECRSCKELRQLVNTTLDSAKKWLRDGDITGAIACTEAAGRLIPSFLTEDHGPLCTLALLKSKYKTGTIH